MTDSKCIYIVEATCRKRRFCVLVAIRIRRPGKGSNTGDRAGDYE